MEFYERSGYCKACHIAYMSARVRAQRMRETPEEREERLAQRRLKRHGRAERVHHFQPPGVPDGMRWCSACGEIQPAADFYRSRSKPNGRASRCKACSRLKSRAYYEANREGRIAYQAARRDANPEAARAYEREVYGRRREKHQAANRARERSMKAPDSATVAYEGVLRGDPCCYCGVSGRQQVDHIVPVANGGANHWTNLTAACRRCNRAKSARSLLAHLSTGAVYA